VLNLRPLGPGDDDLVREVFWSTFVLGREPDGLPRLQRYEDLCLGWYLGPERAEVRLVVDGATPVGYVLVGSRPDEHRRWLRRRATWFALAEAAALAGGRRPALAGRFVRLRIADGWALRSAPSPMPVHVHLNLLPAVRGFGAARLLVDHADDVCRRVGSPGWFGEINAPVGRRAAALERLGLRVVHRSPNRTLSELTDRPVERLTAVRTLASPVPVAS
jgi:GNAT superfamily N-acetyltransferase